MLVLSVKQTLPGVYEITPDAGSAFFLRTQYLSQCPGLDFSELEWTVRSENPLELTEQMQEDFLRSALLFFIEKAAMNYLARAEQYRAGLLKKLVAKGMDRKDVLPVLDFLESKNYLDDLRYAGAWLRSRSIDHAEGRIKLGAELAARGIGREDSKKALDQFFMDHDENEICLRACQKLLKTQKDTQKLYASLMRLGFSSSLIKNSLQQLKNS